MRSTYINNFQMAPTIAEAAAAATPDDGNNWVDDTVAVGGVVANIINSITGKTKVVYAPNGTATYPVSTSTNNNTIIYILLALAVIVGLYFFLKK